MFDRGFGSGVKTTVSIPCISKHNAEKEMVFGIVVMASDR